MKYALIDTKALITRINDRYLDTRSHWIPILLKQNVFPIKIVQCKLTQNRYEYIMIGKDRWDMGSAWAIRFITVSDEYPGLIKYETVLAKLL